MNRLIVALALAIPMSASAQELNLAMTGVDRPHIVQMRTGLDHALVAGLGYQHVVGWGDRQFFVGGDFAMPWAAPDLGDYRLRATMGLPLLGSQHWKLATWLSPTLRGTENSATRMVALGADLHLAGGYYARGWFIVGELGLDCIATTHMRFSQAYRTRAYSGAQDGWYGVPGGTTYAGLHGGLSFSSFDLVLRLGQPRSLQLAQQAVPFYVTLGVNVSL